MGASQVSSTSGRILSDGRGSCWSLKTKEYFYQRKNRNVAVCSLAIFIPISQLNLSWKKNSKAQEKHVHVKLRHFNIDSSFFKLSDSFCRNGWKGRLDWSQKTSIFGWSTKMQLKTTYPKLFTNQRKCVQFIHHFKYMHAICVSFFLASNKFCWFLKFEHLFRHPVESFA